MKKLPVVQAKWELRSYDVWGNSKDGFEVNDCYCFDRSYPIDLKLQFVTWGTAKSALFAPTDKQIREAFGITCQFETEDNGDGVIYITRKRDQYPIGEMFLVSPSQEEIREMEKAIE